MPIRHSVVLLRDEAAPPGLVAVAVVALAEAIQRKLEVPNETARVLWAAVRRSPDAPWSSTATEAIGALAGADLVADVLETVLDANAGFDLRNAGLDVLPGASAAPHVTDRDLLALAERSGGRLVRPASNLVRAVCDARRVPPDVVQAIAEGWSRRRDVGARLVTLELVDILQEAHAQRLVERALSDEHSGVRSTAVLRIADVFDRDAGLGVVEHALVTETHNVVSADLLRAKADLLTMASV